MVKDKPRLLPGMPALWSALLKQQQRGKTWENLDTYPLVSTMLLMGKSTTYFYGHFQ